MNLVPIDRKLLLFETHFDYVEHAATLRDCITQAVPESHDFILVDDASMSIDVIGDRRPLPFLESGGVFNGWPDNDTEAIAEIERMRADGASFIVFAKPAFYWLDFYSGLREYLCQRFPCLAYRSHPGHAVCVIFDLRQLNNGAMAPNWRRIHADDIRHPQCLVPEPELKEAFTRATQTLKAELSPEAIGDYLEFGVYVGTSLSNMFSVLRELGLDHVRLFGFDSFSGLPEETLLEDVDWKPGDYACEMAITRQFLNERAIDPERVSLIDGWFENTLKRCAVEEHGIRKAGIIMVDCDIYASTVDVLRFCEPLIQDQAIIFFDDWHSSGLADRNQGQKRAFDEFVAAHSQFSVANFESYSDNSAAFHVKRTT